MAKKFVTSIDLNKNELQNALAHPLGSAPSTPAESQIYYNSTDKTLYIWNGSAWLDIGGVVRTIVQSGTNAVTFGGTASAVTVSIADATTTNSGLLSSTHWDLLNEASSTLVATLVLRDVNGDFTANDLTINSITGLVAPSAGSDAANKTYVDGLVASNVTFKGSYDASTNAPNLDVASNNIAYEVGDMYTVTVAGNFYTEALEIGDSIIASTARAANSASIVIGDWTRIQKNVDLATDTTPGIVELATQAEVDAGTDTSKAVTPETLSNYSGLGSGGDVTKFTALVGDNSSTTITVLHGLVNQNVQTQLFDASTNDEVVCDIQNFDANNVKLTFTVAPTTNQYRVVIHG